MFIEIRPSVKYLLVLWSSVFFALHLFVTLPSEWSPLLWMVSAWINAMAILWIIYWGTLNKGVNVLSLLFLSWLSYMLVWFINVVDWFSWIGVNAQAIRILVSSAVLVLGIFAIWKKNRPHLNRMMIIGGIGVIITQGIYAFIFNYSYLVMENIAKDNHKTVITYHIPNDVSKECERRGWACVQGGSEDVSPPQLHPNKHTIYTVILASKFLKRAMTNKQNGVSSWSWYDEWIEQPNANWPALFTHSRQGNGVQWIVVDPKSMMKFVKNNTLYFSIMSTLGGAVWIFGSLFLWWFHQKRWNQRNAVNIYK